MRRNLRLIVPALVIAEVTYLVGRRLGPAIEARIIAGLASLNIQAPYPEDWSRIAEITSQYADSPLGGTDACVVALAEGMATAVVLTLDRRHFAALRPRHCDHLTLLPD